MGAEDRAGAWIYCTEGLDSRIIVSDTRCDVGCATYVTLVFRAGRVNSTSSSHLGRAVYRQWLRLRPEKS